MCDWSVKSTLPRLAWLGACALDVLIEAPGREDPAGGKAGAAADACVGATEELDDDGSPVVGGSVVLRPGALWGLEEFLFAFPFLFFVPSLDGSADRGAENEDGGTKFVADPEREIVAEELPLGSSAWGDRSLVLVLDPLAAALSLLDEGALGPEVTAQLGFSNSTFQSQRYSDIILAWIT